MENLIDHFDLIDHFNTAKKKYNLNYIKLVLDNTSSCSHFNRTSKTINLIPGQRNLSILYHELRHAIVLDRLGKFKLILDLLRLLNGSVISSIFNVISYAIYFYILLFGNNFQEINDYFIIILKINMIFYLPVWLEELDANIFAYKKSKQIKWPLLSQISYSKKFHTIFYVTLLHASNYLKYL